MGYSIGEAAKRLNISAHTLRFYDKVGLLPFVGRNRAGNREFVDADMRLLETILCLKSTGMKLKEIKQYINWVMDGPDTVKFRKMLMMKHRDSVTRQAQELKKNLGLINIKLKIYESPDAAEIVREQLRRAAEERYQQGLCAR